MLEESHALRACSRMESSEDGKGQEFRGGTIVDTERDRVVAVYLSCSGGRVQLQDQWCGGLRGRNGLFLSSGSRDGDRLLFVFMAKGGKSHLVYVFLPRVENGCMQFIMKVERWRK